MLSGGFVDSLFSFFSGSSSEELPPQTKTPSVFNPRKLSVEDSVSLGKLIHQAYLHTNQRFFPLGMNDIEHHKFILTKPLLIRSNVNSLDNSTDYHIEILGEVLGKGAYGVVYTSLDKLVRQADGSLKRKNIQHAIKDEAIDDYCTLDDVLMESKIGRVMVGSKAPVVTEVNGKIHAFMVENYFDGRDLEKVLKLYRAHPNLNADQRCNILVELLLTAKKMHALGIIHRDIKPSNIIIVFLKDYRVRVYIIDFNLSKWIHDKKAPSLSGAWGYAAPEIQQNRNDESTDNYSLSIVAAEIFGAMEPEINTVKPDFHFRGLFRGCSGLDEQHRNRLKKCIYGLKVGDGVNRYSHDNAIAILDQVLLERKLKQLSPSDDIDAVSHAYTTAIQTKSIIWNALRQSLSHIENIYREQLISLASEVNEAPPHQITMSIRSYLDAMDNLKSYLAQTVDSLNDHPTVISAFTEAARIHIFDGVETKKELLNIIDYIFDYYVHALTMLNTMLARLKALIYHVHVNELYHHHHFGHVLWTLLEAVGKALAKCGDYSFTFDDLTVLTKKLDKSVLRIACRLEELEDEIESLFLKQESTRNNPPSVTGLKAALFSHSPQRPLMTTEGEVLSNKCV